MRWGRDSEQRQGDECVRRLMQYMVQGRDDVVWFRVKIDLARFESRSGAHFELGIRGGEGGGGCQAPLVFQAVKSPGFTMIRNAKREPNLRR